MNYLAHLYLAKPNSYSLAGNLMGDFTRGLDIQSLPIEIQKGIKNHRSVDKFTDNHHAVRQLKPLLTDKRKRFSGIISDVVFDHFLAKHWHLFSDQKFSDFNQHCYQQLLSVIDHMPPRMQFVVTKMAEQDWLSSYQHLEMTGRAIDNLSKRIRFENNLHGAIEEVEQHYQHYHDAFMQMFPDLKDHVSQNIIE
ncbi:ACP phosphodiesterase [Thalassotalea crassostreae]|uniref:acyl carrier protein phosphodiesterase n=1 Tax=Thalassotalea crassostreae TaxID=1763536 RepID=UPI00083951CE|nr:ACP phosphodiesterase [Thalassotalea crassostreae]